MSKNIEIRIKRGDIVSLSNGLGETKDIVFGKYSDAEQKFFGIAGHSFEEADALIYGLKIYFRELEFEDEYWRLRIEELESRTPPIDPFRPDLHQKTVLDYYYDEEVEVSLNRQQWLALTSGLSGSIDLMLKHYDNGRPENEFRARVGCWIEEARELVEQLKSILPDGN